MVIGKMTSDFIEQFVTEINKTENIDKVKNKVFVHIYNYLHKYLIFFYLGFAFLCVSIIILLIAMIKVLNKLTILESTKC
jgi:Trk-type K+ transport system membrane component